MAQDRLITEAVLEARIAPSIDRALRAIEDLQNAIRELGSAFNPVQNEARQTSRGLEDVGRTGRRAGRQAAQGIRRLRDSLRDATQDASGLRAALTAVATAGIFTQQQRQFEQFQQFRIEAPQLDEDQARRAFRAAQVLGFDEGFFSTFFKDLEERIGEGTDDVQNALAELGTSAAEVLSLDEFERFTFLAERLAQADADRRIFLADVLAAGQGGELLSRAAFDPQFLNQVTRELERESNLTEEQFQNWERSQQAVGRITTSLSEITQLVLGSWAPILEFVASSFEAIVRFAGRLEDILGPIFGVLSSIVVAVTTIATTFGGIGILAAKIFGASGLLAAAAPALPWIAAIAGVALALFNLLQRFREFQEEWDKGVRAIARATIEFLVNTLTVPGILTSLGRDLGLTDINLGEAAGNFIVRDAPTPQIPVNTSPTGRGEGQSSVINLNVNVDRIDAIDDIQEWVGRQVERAGGFF